MALYTEHNNNPAFDLHYSWSGWPQPGGRFPPKPDGAFFDGVSLAWLNDGLTLASRICTPDQVQLTFSATPRIAPVFLAARVKGRLQHALRQAGTPVAFSRKVSVRSLGHNVTHTVTDYIRDQLQQVNLADPRYRDMLARQAVVDAGVDLTQPSETNSGRYWYNLHLVLVTAARYRMGGERFLANLRESTLDAIRRDGCAVKALAIMPDHMHVAIRGNIEKSPAELAVNLLNATARAAGCRIWMDRFYAGTFSEYDMRAVE